MFVQILCFLLSARVLFASPNLMDKLPLHFESAGEGYLAQASGYFFHARHGEARLGIATDVVCLRFPGGFARSPQAIEKTGGYTNDLRGRDPSRWSVRRWHYRKVRYEQIYPGVDVIFYGQARQLEYDFQLAPGVEPGVIRMRFEGVEDLQIASTGELLARTCHGKFLLHKPLAYQWIQGRKVEVESRFVLHNQEIGFAVKGHDPSFALVIDPVISFATYLGGRAADTVTAITLDASNQIYLTGYTQSQNFPVTASAVQGHSVAGRDVFIAKLNATGNQLLFATYLGGTADETPVGIVVDEVGNVTVAGNSDSTDYPVTGAATFQGPGSGIFLSRVSADGTQLLASTFFGGNETAGRGIAAALTRDPSGHLVLVGQTTVPNFPVTSGVFQPEKRQDSDAFLARISPSLNRLLFSTFLGGDGQDQAQAVSTDAQGNIYVVGHTNSLNFPVTAGAFTSPNRGRIDTFVSKLNSLGSVLEASTILGGSDGDFGRAIAIGPNGHVYVAGLTYSNNFPTTPGVFQFLRPPTATPAFLTKLSPSFDRLEYSTYFGSTGNYYDIRGIASVFVDANDNATLIGHGLGSGLPVTPGALQSLSPGLTDGFLATLNPTADIVTYGTFLGGAGDDFVFAAAVDSANNFYLAGSTTSTNFPVTTGAHQTIYQTNTDGFLAKVDMAGVSTSCSFTLAPSSVTVDSLGGTNTATLTTASGCSWSATSTQPWVVITEGTSGAGSTTITYRVDPNPTATSRTAQIRVSGATLAITQTASPCLFNIEPQNRTMPASGGVISFLVTAPTGCSWTASSNALWLRLTGATSGNGAGVTPVTVEENATGIPRNGSVTIARQWVHILQPAANPQMAFDDVPLTHLFANHIFLMKHNNIADTCNDSNQFCP
ncbi:MAG: SBBP repeat-containing protein [Bryobacteraceae bacterium]|nr:SBBP repeat-containing protein [Bryobacteraceae bacterium]MDW8380038.1 SBBP repeat-containing protein [Bryobacterales bacterium]